MCWLPGCVCVCVVQWAAFSSMCLAEAVLTGAHTAHNLSWERLTAFVFLLFVCFLLRSCFVLCAILMDLDRVSIRFFGYERRRRWWWQAMGWTKRQLAELYVHRTERMQQHKFDSNHEMHLNKLIKSFWLMKILVHPREQDYEIRLMHTHRIYGEMNIP